MVHTFVKNRHRNRRVLPYVYLLHTYTCTTVSSTCGTCTCTQVRLGTHVSKIFTLTCSHCKSIQICISSAFLAVMWPTASSNECGSSILNPTECPEKLRVFVRFPICLPVISISTFPFPFLASTSVVLFFETLFNPVKPGKHL